MLNNMLYNNLYNTKNSYRYIPKMDGIYLVIVRKKVYNKKYVFYNIHDI